jgi:hypothetical protein
VQSCLEYLRRVAPTSALTRQALAEMPRRASWLIWALRALLLSALAGTLAHAELRRRRPLSPRLPRHKAAPVSALVVAAYAVLCGGGASAASAAPEPRATLGDVTIDDANPEASVPSQEDRDRRPLQFGYYLQDLATRAEEAAKRGDHAAAARFYRALFKAAPEVSYAPRKVCEALEAAHDVAGAVLACRTAITREGTTAADYVHFVNLVLSQPGQLPPLEQTELKMVLDHLDAEAKLGPAASHLRCQVALRFHDLAALETCSRELAQAVPDDPQTVSFQWALALEKHDETSALRLVDRARELGMSQDGVARMQKATSDMRGRWMLRLALFVVAAAAAVASVFAAIRWLASRRRLAL